MGLNHLIKQYPRSFILAAALAFLYLLLLIPTDHNPIIPGGNKKPFMWNRDSVWNDLELQFKRSKGEGCDKIKSDIDSLILGSENLLTEISVSKLNPSDKKFRTLENNIFRIAPLLAACSQNFPDFINLYSKLRITVKRQSENWDMNSTETRNILYRLLYGNRTAIEEIILQLPQNNLPALIKGTDEPSSTPSAMILGVEVHSGDILVSRGGAPTSALIARGNDFPGNLSHVALIYIDGKTKLVSIIESHIERGVVISSLDEYLNDKKLRIMVLRLRSDLIQNNPMVPHLAAEYLLNLVRNKHIPYDFEMNFHDPDEQFCSEVAFSAYKKFGITLWTGLSSISSKGIRTWLAAFGVKYFETQEPSDLEYDPQMSVVAEWRNPETLYQDHIDNAVTDVMLEEADSGKMLTYNIFALPAGRIMKLYSMILNSFGSEGPIPEGMSPEAALKNVKYSNTHSRIKERLIVLADRFKLQNGYTPPYWELIKLARLARKEING